MALLDVLANVFTAGAFGKTKRAAGLPKGQTSEIGRLAAGQQKFDQLQRVVPGAGGNRCGQSEDDSSSDFEFSGVPPFQLQDGLLLETGTGRVWRYDAEDDAFIELRLLPSPAEERVFPDILMDQIETTESKIERVLRDFPDQQKQAVRSALEENYRKALVWALVRARAVTAETSTMAAR